MEPINARIALKVTIFIVKIKEVSCLVEMYIEFMFQLWTFVAIFEYGHTARVTDHSSLGRGHNVAADNMSTSYVELEPLIVEPAANSLCDQ